MVTTTTADQHQQQHHEVRLAPKPPTVSSTSSIDTAAYADLHDTSGHDQSISFVEQSTSTVPSLALGNAALTFPASSNQSIDSFAMHPHAPFQTTVAKGNSGNGSSSSGGGNVGIVVPTPLAHTTTTTTIDLRSTLHLSGSTGLLVPSVPTTNTVPEFLYQLTKMLTDNNRDIIEWSNGKIEVHSPHKLESMVLNRYFRHSKFASFQRQLNYFGFRKLAGKGKMAPCSYVNDSTTDELGSLLLVKRKHGTEPKCALQGGKKRDRDMEGGEDSNPEEGARSSAQEPVSSSSVNPVLAGILYRSASTENTAALPRSLAPEQSQKALARVAVGKGIRHGFIPQLQPATSSINRTATTSSPQVVVPSPVQASLNALTNNFKNSLQGLQSSEQQQVTIESDCNQLPTDNISDQVVGSYQSGSSSTLTAQNIGYIPGSLRRDDSLVDLAMIPIVENGMEGADAACSTGFSFVDFPFDSSYFSNEDPLAGLPPEG